jgi:hypothetical protein
MAHTLLTPTAVTRKALMILHQKLNFVGSINRQYDDSFAKSGAKIGADLKIRLPNQFTVRTGKTISTQDITEQSVTLTIATQKGVDFAFDSADLTLSIDDYAERILEPAMARLAAAIESDVITGTYKEVYNEVSDVGATATAKLVLEVGKKLTDNLAPVSNRTLNMSTQVNLDLVDALKGLFNDPAKLSKQYRDGMVAADFLGFEKIFQNTHWPIHTTGTDDGTGDYLVNQSSVSEGATSITVDTGAGTWKKGDIFFFDSVFRVHPETKVSTGKLQQFVVTADVSASATTINFSPALYSSGALQNVSAMPANNAALYKREFDESTAIGNAADYGISMGYHRDFAAIAFADLVMPKGAHMASRQVYDGISMRFWADGDITNDSFPARFDVLYGYKVIRPELACRLGLN